MSLSSPSRLSRANVKRLIWGLTVVAAGILSGIYQLGYISHRELMDFWPLILITFGLCYLFGTPEKAKAGGLFLLAGVLLLLGNQLLPTTRTMEIQIGFLDFRLGWPLLLVVAGIALSWRDSSVAQSSVESSR